MKSELYLPSHVKPQPANLSQYRDVHQPNDLLLFTPQSYFSRAVARHTGGPGWNFCHTEAVVRWSEADALMSVGYQEGIGGTARPLEKIVEARSGHVHVFRVRTAAIKGAILQKRSNNTDYRVGPKELERFHNDLSTLLVRGLGNGYSWQNIALHLFNLLPLTRFLMPQQTYRDLVWKAGQSMGTGICSQHNARTFGTMGIKFTKKNYAMVTPNDIAQSPVCDYLCTLHEHLPLRTTS